MNTLRSMVFVAAQAAAIVALTAVPAASRAQSCGKADAKVLLREAHELVAQGDAKSALPKANRAYECFPDFRMLVPLGTILAKLNRNAEARRAYRQYLDHPAADPKIKKDVQRAYDELGSLVAVLRITVNDSRAAVVVNGDRAGTAAGPVEWEVDPGSHTVVAECSLGAPAVSTVKVGGQERHLVVLQCQRPVAVPSTAVGPTPSSTASTTTSSSHAVETKLPDEAEPGSVTVHRSMAWAVGALALVGLGLGTGFGIAAITTQNEALSHCDDEDVNLCSDEGVELNDDAKTQATVSTVTFAVGAAAAVTSLVLFLTGSAQNGEEPTRAGRLRVLPTAGPGLWGVSLIGAF